jgi:hypothetical protein
MRFNAPILTSVANASAVNTASVSKENLNRAREMKLPAITNPLSVISS